MSKTNIVIPDQYEPFYIHEKRTNPDSKLYWLQMRKGDVEDVDHLVKISRGKRDRCITENDWSVLEEVFDFFAKRWPSEYQEFKKVIPDIRSTRRAGGLSESGGIKYLAALPPRLERLIKTVFPMQQFNRMFMDKLMRRFRLVKVGGERN